MRGVSGARTAAAIGLVVAAAAAGCLDVMRWSGDRVLDAGSYFRSTRAIERAEVSIARADEAGVDQVYPYLLEKARAFVARARERHAASDFPGAERLAEQAEQTCTEAVRFVEERAERMGRRLGDAGSAAIPGP